MSVVEPDSPARNTRSRTRARSSSHENALSTLDAPSQRTSTSTSTPTSISLPSSSPLSRFLVKVKSSCLVLTFLHLLCVIILPTFIPKLAYAAAPVPRIAAGASVIYSTVAELVFRTEKGKNRMATDAQDKGSWLLVGIASIALLNLPLILLWIQGSGDEIKPLPATFKQFHTHITWYGVPLLITFSALALRWLSISTLGDFFSRTLTVFDEHRVVDTGIYSRIRHPGYLANLLLLAGSGVVISGNLLVLAITLVVFLFAWNYRMNVEESMLLNAEKLTYAQYCKRVPYRFIPGIY